MVYRWEMHIEHFQHRGITMSSSEENCIVAIYRSFVLMISIMQILITVVGLRLKAISYIMLEWSSLLLFIISELSAGSGHHLPWPPPTASILQAARLRPPKPVWNGPIPAVWRQWHSLLVSKNPSLFPFIERFRKEGQFFLIMDLLAWYWSGTLKGVGANGLNWFGSVCYCCIEGLEGRGTVYWYRQWLVMWLQSRTPGDLRGSAYRHRGPAML